MESFEPMVRTPPLTPAAYAAEVCFNSECCVYFPLTFDTQTLHVHFGDPTDEVVENSPDVFATKAVGIASEPSTRICTPFVNDRLTCVSTLR